MADTEEQIEKLEELIEMYEKMTRTGESGIDAQVKLWLSTSRAGQSVTALGDAAGKATKGLKDSAKSIGGSTGNFNDLTAAVTGVIGAVSGLLGKIPVIGGIIEGLGDAAQELAQFTISQTQSGFDSFQQLSKAGQIGADGVTGLARSIDEAGIPLQTYAKLLTSNSTALAYFNTSALKGGKSFGKLMTEMQDGQGHMLRNLGFSLEEIGETAIGYQTLQQRLGFAQEMDQDKLAKSAASYGKELDIISKLTGESRKDIQAKRMDQLRDSRFAAYLRTLNDEERERVIKTAANMALIGDEAGKAFRGAATGFVTGDAERQAMVAGTYDTMREIHKQSRDGTAKFAKTANQMKDASAIAADRFMGLVSAVGDTGVIGAFSEIDKIARMNVKEQEAAIAAQKAQTKTTKEGGDKATNALTKSMTTMQKTTAEMNGMFIATKLGTEGIELFTDTLAASVDMIATAFGVDTATERKEKRAKIISDAAAGNRYSLGLGKGETGKISASQSPELQKALADIKRLEDDADDDDGMSAADIKLLRKARETVERSSVKVDDLIKELVPNAGLGGWNVKRRLGLGDDDYILPSQAALLKKAFKAAVEKGDIVMNDGKMKSAAPSVRTAFDRTMGADIVQSGPGDATSPTRSRPQELKSQQDALDAALQQTITAADADGHRSDQEKQSILALTKVLKGIQTEMNGLKRLTEDGNNDRKRGLRD